MIGYLRGNLVELDDERVILCVGGVGYEVLLPAIEMRALRARLGEALHDAERLRAQEVELYVYEHIADRQPNTLFGFNQRLEKDFFRLLITVSDIGPATAAKAMAIPVAEIAAAIERRDTRVLSSPGIGKRRRQMVATLKESRPLLPGSHSDPERHPRRRMCHSCRMCSRSWWSSSAMPHEAEGDGHARHPAPPRAGGCPGAAEEILTGEKPS